MSGYYALITLSIFKRFKTVKHVDCIFFLYIYNTRTQNVCEKKLSDSTNYDEKKIAVTWQTTVRDFVSETSHNDFPKDVYQIYINIILRLGVLFSVITRRHAETHIGTLYVCIDITAVVTNIAESL